MSKTRLYFDGPLVAEAEIELDGDQARYVNRVLRLRRDDRVTLFNGDGAEYPSIIRSPGKDRVAVSVIGQCNRSVESALRLHLLQGVSRGERMDHVVQKATELGAQRITPVMTEYSMVKLKGERADKRIRHWRGVASSACEQCGRNTLPELDPPVALRDWLGRNPDGAETRLAFRPGAADSLAALQPAAAGLTVLIGPEGGLSEAEYDLVAAVGFRLVRFGPRILRTETAAVAVIAALQTLYGDFR